MSERKAPLVTPLTGFLLAMIALLIITGISIKAVLEPTQAQKDRAATPTTAAPFPTGAPGFDPSLSSTNAKVSAKQPLTIDGADDRQIAVTATDGSALSVSLDCSLCTGTAKMARDDHLPLWAQDAPASTTQRFAFNPGENHTIIKIEAHGSWRLKVTTEG